VAIALTATAHAQRMGSSNRAAPTVTQSIAFPSATIELSYTSITWAGGQWKAALDNEASRGDQRTRINDAAAKSPLGTLKLPAAMSFGATKVAAGTYKVAFTLDEKFKWQLSLTSDAGVTVVPLELKACDDDCKRLVLGLRAGEKDGTAELVVAFGKERCVLAITAAA
jgi:hypothetical protein